MSVNAHDAFNRLCKWRTILAGWQLGTRSKEDPESQAVRDTREILLLLRVEVNAITQLLIREGVFDLDDFNRQLITDAHHLEDALERKFPGAHAEQDGMHIIAAKAAPWMGKFRP